MAENLKPLKCLCVLLLLASSFILITEGRPCPLHGEKFSGSVSKGIEAMLEGLYVSGVKTGGPSSGGKGHSSTNSRNLRVTIKSGPSPGVGH